MQPDDLYFLRPTPPTRPEAEPLLTGDTTGPSMAVVAAGVVVTVRAWVLTQDNTAADLLVAGQLFWPARLVTVSAGGTEHLLGSMGGATVVCGRCRCPTMPVGAVLTPPADVLVDTFSSVASTATVEFNSEHGGSQYFLAQIQAFVASSRQAAPTMVRQLHACC